MNGRPVPTTAWGAAWLERLVLARTFDGAELGRGRSLAARGGVVELGIEPAGVSALVVDRSLERRVRLGVRRRSDADWASVRERFAASGRVLAALLDGVLPDEVHRSLEDAGLGLLPGVADVSIDCSCGNQAESCVHAAAVCVRVAEEIDRDPLLLLTLRGADRGALLASLLPSPAAGAGGPGGANAGLAGRAEDPGMPAAQAWRRRPAPLPDVSPRRGAPGPLRVGVVVPPAELGVDLGGVERLMRDAAIRAARVLAGSSASGLDLSMPVDAVRRAAAGTLAAADSVTAVLVDAAGVDPESVPGLVDAWDRCGAPGVEVLLTPRRLDADELAAVAAAGECEVKGRSTGAVLPGGRQIRRAADGTWVVLAADQGGGGWSVVDAGRDLDDLL